MKLERKNKEKEYNKLEKNNSHVLKCYIDTNNMKKIVFLIIIIFFLTSCTKINNNYLNLVNNILTNQKMQYKTNTFQGYSFYLPIGVQIISKNNNNLVLKQGNNTLYLYIDLISYYNKVKKDYIKDEKAYFSTSLKNGDYFGYLEINLWKNDKYLVEIMYNYAKIEVIVVIVESKELKNVLSYATAILSSITYNDTIIENMIGEDILDYNELELNIFETIDSNNNGSIQYDENSSFNTEQNTIPDLDLIN